MTPRIDLDRLLDRLDRFNRIGALPGGGNCRLALSEEDKAGRDLLVQWMRELGLAVTRRRHRQHLRHASADARSWRR